MTPSSLWSIFQIFVWFEFLRLHSLDITFKHTTGLLRGQGFQKKYKRLTKVVEAEPKARESKMLIFWKFFSIWKKIFKKKNCFKRKVSTYALWSIFQIFVWKQFLRLYCSNNTFKHTTGLLRCQGFQKKYKRPTKVVKAKPKAREPKMLKF